MLLNDVHSMLNPVAVATLRRPDSLAAVQAALAEARQHGLKVSMSGGRHAMGGQQFAAGALHLDLSGLDRVLGADPVRGLLTIEAGADWPRIIAASHAMGHGPDGRGWGIRQKQTGVDTVSLGGSIAANAHGRGLLLAPLAADIEDLLLVDADGRVRLCSRSVEPELFALAIGGYGLFGVIQAATLRLAPRLRVRRRVDVIDLDDAVNAVFRRAAEGCLYGDFQFVIDAADPAFLRRGVLACYQPLAAGEADDLDAAGQSADLAPEAWLQLLRLAHEDKRRAFKLYAQHYLETDGNHYWSDTHQLSTYLPDYADFLQHSRAPGVPESLVIGEHYVPPERLLEFMQRARAVLRATGSEVIYGTIRSIRQDHDSFLAWARQDYVCIVFNLRCVHDAAGQARTAASFRGLVDAALELGGSFFLTYHRHASAAQVAVAYPHFRDFLRLKLQHDPDSLFESEWYRHYRQQFAQP